MLRRNISVALLASGTASALLAKPSQAQTCSAPCYALTSAETSAGVTAANSNTEYLPGDVRRYLADPSGVNDSTAALNLAIATGYSLYFCDGNFLTSGNHSPKSNTSWWGTGTLKGKGTNTLVTIGAISNFKFLINTDCSGQTGTSKYALSASGTTYFSIENGNHLQGAIQIGSSSGCNNFIVSGNTMVSTALDNNTAAAAIDVNAKSYDFEITHNQVLSPTGAGIAVYNASYQGVIAHNLCQGCTGCGIYINSAQFMVLQGNVCKGNAQAGIGLNATNPASYGFPQNCTVSGNICTSNTYDGIDYNLATGGAQHATFTTITGNILSDNGAGGVGTGIYLANADETTITGNTVVGNNVQGIFLNSSNYCAVSGNTVIANGANSANTVDGIYISGTFNSVTGNNSSNNGGAANQRYGISETSTSNYNTITGNNLQNNASGPISIAGANTIAHANMPLTYDKLLYSSIFSANSAPSTTGVPNSSLWMNPSVGALYVLQAGTWTAK